MDPNKPQGNGAPEAPQGDDAPSFVTVEAMNKAITARFTAFEKKSSASLSEALKSFTGELDGLLSSKLEGLKPQGKEDAGKPPSVQESPEFKGLQKQLAALQAKADEAEARATSETAKSRDTKLREALREELVRQGVDASRVKQAIGYLVDAEKRAKWSEDGESILFADSRDGDLTLSDGVKSWAKSEDAKIYLPPRDTRGAGDRSGGRVPSSGPQPVSAGRTLLQMAQLVPGGSQER